jgi:hypothetical protein
MQNWNNNLKDGNNAEDMVVRWFGGQTGNNDIKVIFEVKNSWHGSVIHIEEDSVKEQNIKGWIYTTKADCVMFIDYNNEQAVVIETSELKKRYMQIKDHYEIKTQQTERNVATWTSTHRSIPINQFSHTFLKYYQRY